MRRLVAALGAVLLMATMAAAPAAARPTPTAGIWACRTDTGVATYTVTVTYTHFKLEMISYRASNSSTGDTSSAAYGADVSRVRSPYTLTLNQSYWIGATYMFVILQHQEHDGTYHQIQTNVLALTNISPC